MSNESHWCELALKSLKQFTNWDFQSNISLTSNFSSNQALLRFRSTQNVWSNLKPIFSCFSSTQISCHFFRPSGWTKDGASSIKLKASNNQNFTSNLSKFTALAISISQQQIIQFNFRVDLILLQPIRLHFQLAKLNQTPATCKAVRKIPVEENSDDEEAWEHRRHALAAIPAKMGPLNKTRELPLS